MSLFSTDVRRVRDIIGILHNTSVEIFEAKKARLHGDAKDARVKSGLGKDPISVLSERASAFVTSID